MFENGFRRSRVWARSDCAPVTVEKSDQDSVRIMDIVIDNQTRRAPRRKIGKRNL
jgi:hypothetical protein